MIIEVKKQTKETVEIEVPCYYKAASGTTTKIEEGHIVTCLPDHFISVTKKEGMFFQENISEALKGTPITAEEFQQVFETTINSIQNLELQAA